MVRKSGPDFGVTQEPAGVHLVDRGLLNGQEPGALGALGDLSLVAGIARGEPGAMREAYCRHAAAVHGLAHRVCGPSLAEDVVQDVFFKLWWAPEVFDSGRGSLRSYLLTLAWGRATDLVRTEASRRAREVSVSAQATKGRGVEGEVLLDVVAEAIRRALLGLPGERAEAILLAFFGDQSYQQVARTLGQPEGTVKSRIRAGLGQLRAALLQEGILAADDI